MTSLTLNNGLSDIGEAAFANNLLGSLVIPASVTNIQAFAFAVNPTTTNHFEGDRPTLLESGPLASFAHSPLLTTITYYGDTSGWPGSDINGITPTPVARPVATSQAVPAVPVVHLAALTLLFLLIGGWSTRRAL